MGCVQCESTNHKGIEGISYRKSLGKRAAALSKSPNFSSKKGATSGNLRLANTLELLPDYTIEELLAATANE